MEDKFDKIDIMEDRRGKILTTNVSLSDLIKFEPKFFPNFIKFVINPNTNKVNIGMAVHAACQPEMGNKDDLIGGNIFFEDGRIVYESTLNVNKGIEHDPANRRIITDNESIEKYNNVLLAGVNLND